MTKIFLISLILTLFSCSSNNKEKKKRVSENNNSFCEITDIYSKHAKIFAENNISNLKECLKTHVKLHRSSVDFKLCNKININKNGRVLYAKVYAQNVPTDFKWCVEQALWKSDFGALQINENISLTFPLYFEYK